MTDIFKNNNKEHFVSAIIVSAGNSTRMKGINKQFLKLKNIPVIIRSIMAFENNDLVNEIVVVTKKEDINNILNLCNEFNIRKVDKIVPGGKTRQESVINGIKSCSNNCEFVAIHDGARPLISQETISNTISYSFEFGAAATGVKVKDTVKIVDDNDFIVNTPDREYMRFIQTPQVFNKKLYLDAIKSVSNSSKFTDDCMLIEEYGKQVYFVDGDYENIKLTTPEDVELANSYLNRRVHNV